MTIERDRKGMNCQSSLDVFTCQFVLLVYLSKVLSFHRSFFELFVMIVKVINKTRSFIGVCVCVYTRLKCYGWCCCFASFSLSLFLPVFLFAFGFCCDLLFRLAELRLTSRQRKEVLFSICCLVLLLFRIRFGSVRCTSSGNWLNMGSIVPVVTHHPTALPSTPTLFHSHSLKLFSFLPYVNQAQAECLHVYSFACFWIWFGSNKLLCYSFVSVLLRFSVFQLSIYLYFFCCTFSHFSSFISHLIFHFLCVAKIYSHKF